MRVDVLAIGAHPDDVELGVGGLLHKLIQHGRTVAILDLTQGEMSSRGTVETRQVEAREAATRLGISSRENADLPDGAIENTPKQRNVLVPFIRQLQPKVLLAPMAPDRHPDHAAAHALVRDANFTAGLARIETDDAPHRAEAICYYYAYYEPQDPPAFIVDVTAHYEAKKNAIGAYASQFYNPAFDAPKTHISSKGFWDGIDKRAAHWGNRVGVEYGEPLYVTEPLLLELPPALLLHGERPATDE
jgi:bacillithiol biosynthesis deacetylase BshB1